MHRILLSSLALFAWLFLQSQTVWESNFGLPDSTFSIDIQETSDGNLLMYGGTYLGSPDPLAFALKFTPSGDSLWLKIFDHGPGLTSNWGRANGSMLNINVGAYLLCGERTIAISEEDGSTIWDVNITSRDIAISPDGYLHILGNGVIRILNTEGELQEGFTLGNTLNDFLDYESYVVDGDSLKHYCKIKIKDDGSIVLGGTIAFDYTDSPAFYPDNGYCVSFMNSDYEQYSQFITQGGPAWPEISQSIKNAHLFLDDQGIATFISHGASGTPGILKCSESTIINVEYPYWFLFEDESAQFDFLNMQIKQYESLDLYPWIFHEHVYTDWMIDSARICFGEFDATTGELNLLGYLNTSTLDTMMLGLTFFRADSESPIYLSGYKGHIPFQGGGEFFVARFDSLTSFTQSTGLTQTSQVPEPFELNVSDDLLQIRWPESEQLKSVQLMDSRGRLLMTRDTGGKQQVNLDRGTLAKGVYVLVITGKEEEIWTRKIFW